ncbi:unnamed protein product [Ectocarpus sp. 6 AP-2014]
MSTRAADVDLEDHEEDEADPERGTTGRSNNAVHWGTETGGSSSVRRSWSSLPPPISASQNLSQQLSADRHRDEQSGTIDGISSGGMGLIASAGYAASRRGGAGSWGVPRGGVAGVSANGVATAPVESTRRGRQLLRENSKGQAGAGCTPRQGRRSRFVPVVFLPVVVMCHEGLGQAHQGPRSWFLPAAFLPVVVMCREGLGQAHQGPRSWFLPVAFLPVVVMCREGLSWMGGAWGQQTEPKDRATRDAAAFSASQESCCPDHHFSTPYADELGPHDSNDSSLLHARFSNGGAPARSVGSSTTFSVCTALNQLRVSVVKANNVFMCSRGECRKVEQLRAAAGRQGDTNPALADRCQHADVVRKAEVSSQSIPTATACLNGDGEFENALASVPPGTFNEKMVRAMQRRYARAKEEGVPVLVRLAETAWFAVRDGVTFQRNVIGGWGHVKTRSDTTDGSGHMFQCKDTDGVEYEPDGDMGVKEGDRDANMGFAWNIQREDEALFGERMAMARKIIAVYKFPIEEPQLKDGTYGRDKIHVNERICTGCRTPYEVLPDTDAILVGQGAALRIVDVERKKCNTCNLRGWAGDNFLEDGVFNYNENIVVELRVLYQLRLAFRAGTPVSTWLRTFLQPRLDNMDWLEQNPMLASR